MEDDLKKKGRRPPKKKKGRRPQKKNIKKIKNNLTKRNGRQPPKNEKWKTTSKKKMEHDLIYVSLKRLIIDGAR